jgi:hypothetical protein
MTTLRSKTTRKYDTELHRSVIDPCQKKDWFSSFFVKVFAESIQQFSNFRFECPLKKGFYYATNFPIYDVKNDFPFRALRNANTSNEFQFTLTIMAKVNKQNRMVKDKMMIAHIFGVQIF